MNFINTKKNKKIKKNICDCRNKRKIQKFIKYNTRITFKNANA